MSRAAILPFPGDPYLLTYWLHLFRSIWYDEIDQLYIYFNSPIEEKAVKYVQALSDDPKITLYYTPRQIEHGEAIKHALHELVKEDYVMLVEDDGFVFKKTMVDSCFFQLENGRFDIIGSKRGSCSTEIYNAAMAQFGLSDVGLGDNGPNFWPCFFFAPTPLLRKIDNFAAKAWTKGQVVPYINYIVEPDVVASDTMVEASLQLRSMVPIHRIGIVPQYHAHPDDMDHYRNRQFLFDGGAHWCHIGSLSSGIGGILKDDQNRPLARRLIDPPAGPTILDHKPVDDFQKREYERRVQWWLTFWQFYTDSVKGNSTMPELTDLYRLAIDRIIEQYKLSPDRITERQQVFRSLGL